MPHKDPEVRREYLRNYRAIKRQDPAYAKIERERARIYQANLRKRRPGRLYGLTIEEYETRLANQGFACAACGDPLDGDRRPDIDHDHGCCPNAHQVARVGPHPLACGKCVRGILCRTCNRLAVDADRLRKVAAYLDGATLGP